MGRTLMPRGEPLPPVHFGADGDSPFRASDLSDAQISAEAASSVPATAHPPADPEAPCRSRASVALRPGHRCRYEWLSEFCHTAPVLRSQGSQAARYL